MTRYLIVRHPDQKSRLRIHAMLRRYHWETADADHVLVLAEFEPRHLPALDGHPDVLVVPSVFSDATLGEHAQTRGKSRHLMALSHAGIGGQHKAIHVAQAASQKYGPKLSLDL